MCLFLVGRFVVSCFASVDFPVPGDPVIATTFAHILFDATNRREELNMRFRMVNHARYRIGVDFY